MTKPRYRPAPPGRTAWPEIFTYLTSDGVRHCCPPGDNVPYTLDIVDLEAYEALASSGVLYGDAHRGTRRPLIDQRKALQ